MAQPPIHYVIGITLGDRPTQITKYEDRERALQVFTNEVSTHTARDAAREEVKIILTEVVRDHSTHSGWKDTVIARLVLPEA